MARSVSQTCASCGFLLPIGGPLSQAFGVCAHDMSPADGCVVSLAFGCGAHSEIALAEKEPVGAPTQDFVGFDALDLDQVDEIVAEPAAEDVVSEELADASDDADEASDSADQD
jgi:hypothetical protein